MSLIKQCFPHKDVIVRPDDKPWHEIVLFVLILVRDRTKRKASKRGKPENWRAYKKLRHKVNNLKNMQKKKLIIRLKIQLLKPVLPILKCIGNVLENDFKNTS